jgi:hypothetical protein
MVIAENKENVWSLVGSLERLGGKSYPNEKESEEF